MKYTLYIYLIVSLSFINCRYSNAQQKNELDNIALKFLKSVNKKNSKKENLYNYGFIIDLNNDGVYEVIEVINRVENDLPGFLPVQLSSAFEYHKIYRIKDGVYRESNENFEFYQSKRNQFYKTWLLQIENIENLNEEQKLIIKYNKELFIKELYRLINLTNQ